MSAGMPTMERPPLGYVQVCWGCSRRLVVAIDDEKGDETVMECPCCGAGFTAYRWVAEHYARQKAGEAA